MAKVKTIKQQLQHNLQMAQDAGRGKSKHEARQKLGYKGANAGRIYADSTYRGYQQHACHYAEWVRREHPEAWKNMDAAAALVPEYLGQYKSAATRSTKANALAKAFGSSAGGGTAVERWGNTGTRRACDITRGRELTQRAARWRENHADVAEALRCSGLRSGVEATPMRGRDVLVRPDGVYIHVRDGKGHLVRTSRVWESAGNTAGRDWLVAKAQAVGPGGLVFGDVPGLKNANVQAFRQEYAARMYDFHAAEATGKLYHPDNGDICDKGQLAAVSRELGHGDDREYTNYHNYVSPGRGD